MRERDSLFLFDRKFIFLHEEISDDPEYVNVFYNNSPLKQMLSFSDRRVTDEQNASCLNFNTSNDV